MELLLSYRVFTILRVRKSLLACIVYGVLWTHMNTNHIIHKRDGDLKTPIKFLVCAAGDLWIKHTTERESSVLAWLHSSTMVLLFKAARLPWQVRSTGCATFLSSLILVNNYCLIVASLWGSTLVFCSLTLEVFRFRVFLNWKPCRKNIKITLIFQQNGFKLRKIYH